MSFELDQRLVEMVKRFEGFRDKAYRDSAGVWTVGYGCTESVSEGDTCTEAEASAWLTCKLQEYYLKVQKWITLEDAKDYQVAALVSLAYNIGLSAFKASTALREFNKGNLAGTIVGIRMWVKYTNPKTGQKEVLQGLVNRREQEVALFEHGWDKSVEEKKPNSPVKSRTIGGVVIAGVGEILQQGANQLQPFVSIHPYLMYGFVGLTIVGLGVVLFARIDDYVKGKR